MTDSNAGATELAVGVDLGGTQIRAALVDRHGTIRNRGSAPTKAAAGPEAVMAQITELVSKSCEGVDRGLILGAGVSSPGPLDTDAGIALSIPTLAGFDRFPLKAALATALAMPVKLENDGISAALGEWRFGAGLGVKNLVYVTVSTGIGGGVIIDNHVLRGRRGMAGHVGHMSFAHGGEVCACGNRGCFEAYASGTAFTRRAITAAAGAEDTLLGRNGAVVNAIAVFSAAAAGDRLAKALVEEEADMLAQGFASLMHLYSPDILIMGGGLANQFEALQDRLKTNLRNYAMPAFRDIPVVRAALGINSGLVGAASMMFPAGLLAS